MTHDEKHWEVDGHSLTSVVERTIDGWAHLCSCNYRYNQHTGSEGFEVDKSNAHLIAAAPDMLRILRKLSNGLHSSEAINIMYQEIDQAIKKAEG